MPQPSQPRSILVVDDDLPLRKTIEIGLRSAGHRVIGTCGRDEIFALLQSKQFDLVVTDMLMPDIEGTEVVKAVRTFQPDAAIVAMSGGGTRMTPELCLAAASTMGASVPLIKPFKMDALLRAVDQALALRDRSMNGL
jgi:DNA-binding NtrC family response regulator